jgi:ATPase subunit of ABC transporter with duplicated ATPase domains
MLSQHLDECKPLPDGGRVPRSLRQLSGGERRRAALALALAHADLASARGGVTCDLLVLDEVLQHLDAVGPAKYRSPCHGL